MKQNVLPLVVSAVLCVNLFPSPARAGETIGDLVRSSRAGSIEQICRGCVMVVTDGFTLERSRHGDGTYFGRLMGVFFSGRLYTGSHNLAFETILTRRTCALFASGNENRKTFNPHVSFGVVSDVKRSDGDNDTGFIGVRIRFSSGAFEFMTCGSGTDPVRRRSGTYTLADLDADSSGRFVFSSRTLR